jgi:hypothetical protein
MTQGALLRGHRGLYVAGAIFAAAIAVWDVATHGSILVALVMSITSVTLSFSAAFPKTVQPLFGQTPTDSSWFSRVAFATGFPSSRSLATRSTLGVAGGTLLQRFVLYPSAALAFDVLIAIAMLALGLLASWFVVRARYPN